MCCSQFKVCFDQTGLSNELVFPVFILIKNESQLVIVLKSDIP